MKTAILLSVWVISFIVMILTAESLSSIFGASLISFGITSIILSKLKEKGAKK